MQNTNYEYYFVGDNYNKDLTINEIAKKINDYIINIDLKIRYSLDIINNSIIINIKNKTKYIATNFYELSQNDTHKVRQKALDKMGGYCKYEDLHILNNIIQNEIDNNEFYTKKYLCTIKELNNFIKSYQEIASYLYGYSNFYFEINYK